MCISLTAECWRSPLQDNSSLTALRRVSLQHFTQTLVHIGSTGTQIIHAWSIEHLGWHQLMTALKHGGLQHCTASVRSLTGRVTSFITWINIFYVRTLKTWISTAHLQVDQSIYSLTFIWNTLLINNTGKDSMEMLVFQPSSCFQTLLQRWWFVRCVVSCRPENSYWSCRISHTSSSCRYQEHWLPDENGHSTTPYITIH